ncbi:hypothetical protein ACFST9_00750 [Hymenobacter monticola]|uniref:Uncharacterized protein n=1 Tax=Hymenobacter monticola TaxID=1705399 RepID=A0ABY4B2Z3_9BACT|nr:hypothetical protein [Hymenobacter monticola]UOE33507.1 hypothetical protein MTP16_20580 [Hymenobacter monticola]
MLRFVSLLLLGVLLLGSAACKKTEPVEIDGVSFVDGLPYYHFIDADRQWFSEVPGTVWTFENGRGVQRRYTVSITQHLQIKNKIRISGILSDSYKLVSYYDEAIFALTNVDATSSDSGGRFEFYTDPTVTPNHQPVSGQSRLRAQANWFAFLGTEKCITDYYHPKNDQLSGPFEQLASRGTSYSEVARFSVFPRGQSAPPSAPTSLFALYYDHQHGLIRLVDWAGDVWNRVP